MNLLCIVDEDHQWWVIAVDHTSKSEVAQPILNPSLMAYNTENGASFRNCQVNHKFYEKDIGYYRWKLWKKKVKHWMLFRNYSSTLTRALSTTGQAGGLDRLLRGVEGGNVYDEETAKKSGSAGSIPK